MELCLTAVGGGAGA
jgi:hypothetical protein